MGVRTPETFWAVNKRQDNKLEKLLHLVGDLFELKKLSIVIKSTGIISQNSINWWIFVAQPLLVCEVLTRCVDTYYTRFVFQSGPCQYHSSYAPRLPLSYYYYNQKDERMKPSNKRRSFAYRGRWTDEYFHGTAGQTFKSTLSNIKFIQSVERVHDYVWL